MDVAAVAAFTAAGLSLVNVWVAGRLSRKGQTDQWRRDTERPIVARILTLSDQCLPLWGEAALAKEMWIATLQSQGHPGDVEVREKMESSFRAGHKLLEELQLQVAELDLVAGRPLREIAYQLINQHEWLQHVIRPSGGAEDPESVYVTDSSRIVGLRVELIRRARVDLRVDGRTSMWFWSLRTIRNIRLTQYLRAVRRSRALPAFTKKD